MTIPDSSRTAAAVDILFAEATGLAAGIAAADRMFKPLAKLPAGAAAADLREQNRAHCELMLRRQCAILTDLSDQLRTRNELLETANEQLRQENERLTQKLKRSHYELQRALGITGGSEIKPCPAAEPAPETGQVEKSGKQPKRRGAPKGHRGKTRPMPEKVDFENVIAPPAKCSCGCDSIVNLYEYDMKYIEDIPPVSRIVTRNIYLRGRCPACGELVQHPEALQGPPVQTGPNLAVQLAMMNQAGMTFGKLAGFSTRTLGIPLTASGVLGIVERVTASLTECYNDIGEALRRQDALNGDETGWKILNRNSYIWCFCNDKFVYYHPDFRRSGAVVEEILGSDFPGVVMCDFYGAYNIIEKKQRCLVHLLRDISKEREILADSKLLEAFDRELRNFIEEGLRVKAMPEGRPKAAELAELKKRLDRISAMQVTKGRGQTLVKRVARYRDELIHFVSHPGVEFHNNRAERMLRPMVITRKMSFGSNTEMGAMRHCILNSIVETCRLQKRDPVDFLMRAYTSNGLDVADLTANSPPAA